MLITQKNKNKIISGMDCMLIPINWVPAFYMSKFLPSHLMASFLSLNSIQFFTCCCMTVSNCSISELFVNNSDFKLQLIWYLLFSPCGRENDKITRNSLCLFMLEYCNLPFALTFMQRIDIFYLTNWNKKVPSRKTFSISNIW